MREILFRGKRLDNGKWVEGAFCPKNCDSIFGPMVDKPSIIKLDKPNDGYWFDVEPDTVGQYTGLRDKNGKRIFEGDILKTHYANAKNSEFVEVVVFRNGKFCAEGNLGGGGRSWAPLWDGVPHVPQDKTIYMDSMEVIGNIHDNPELLEAPHEDR